MNKKENLIAKSDEEKLNKKKVVNKIFILIINVFNLQERKEKEKDAQVLRTQIRMQCCCLSIQLSEDWKLETQIYCFPSK